MGLATALVDRCESVSRAQLRRSEGAFQGIGCSLTIAIFRACVNSLRFDIAVVPIGKPLNSSTYFWILLQIRQNTFSAVY